MSIGLVLEETMSGSLTLGADGIKHPFGFTIRAFSPRILTLTGPRIFRGIATLDGLDLPVSGTLTIRPTGPRYELSLTHPALGLLQISGEKTYSLSNLAVSLTTCPLTVYSRGEAIGTGEVVYRDSMLSFPFKALKLASADKAFGNY